MSSITTTERLYFEHVLGMKSGYVHDFTNRTFEEFFEQHQIEIYAAKYSTYGGSKANRLRAFWEQESDQLVADVLADLIELYEATCAVREAQPNDTALAKCRAVVSRLRGTLSPVADKGLENFLDKDFVLPVAGRLPIEPQVATVIEARLKESQIALDAGAYLSVIFLCGSVLEAALLGMAQMEPAKFNRSPTSPRGKDGKPKKFTDWSLAQLIDTAHDVGGLKQDVQKFSHALRDFRNYIHPYQQVVHGFTPDEHTAKLCFQTLKAALADLAGER